MWKEENERKRKRREREEKDGRVRPSSDYNLFFLIVACYNLMSQSTIRCRQNRLCNVRHQQSSQVYTDFISSQNSTPARSKNTTIRHRQPASQPASDMRSLYADLLDSNNSSSPDSQRWKPTPVNPGMSLIVIIIIRDRVH